MSDWSQGPGWWQASDGKWYPPESRPGQAPASSPAPSSWGPPAGPQQGYEPPSVPAPGWNQGALPPGPSPANWQPQPGYGGPPPQQRSNRGLWIALSIIVGVIVLVVGGCFAALAIVGNAVGDSVDDFFEELSIDFSGAVPATGPSSCQVTGERLDIYDVDVTVTNESGVTSSYRVSYELRDGADTILGTDFGVLVSVAPGETQTRDARNVVSGIAEPSAVTCQVLSAERVPAAS